MCYAATQVEPVPVSDDVWAALAQWGVTQGTTSHLAILPHFRNAANAMFIDTTSGRYVLKRVPDRALVDRSRELLSTLRDCGIPVAPPIPTPAGSSVAVVREQAYTLSPFIPGQIVMDHYGPGATQRAHRYGTALADLHRGLRHCGRLPAVPEVDLGRDVRGSVATVRDFYGGADAARVRACLLELADFETRVRRLPAQIIHGDAHASNVLFQDDQVSGWIDFDAAAVAPRLVDVCYCATSLLMNGISDASRRRIWLDLVAAILDGYQASEPLEAYELASVWYMLLAMETGATAYYIGKNDGQGIRENIDGLLWIADSRSRIVGAG